MEFGSVVEFLENKTILVTGATGFLAKVFLEKVLRVQPNVKRIYLLLRASDFHSASQRFKSEIIEKDLFRVVKEKLGTEFNNFISQKVIAVPGDIADGEDLGVKDSNWIEELWRELDVVVNIAATTRFDERYDIALGTNTLGAKHVLFFAKKCIKLQVLLHVSTAYVSGVKRGLILEFPHEMGQSLNGVSGLDISEEKKLIDHTLIHLRAQGATDDQIKEAMKDLGLTRAKKYGWPNTYTFTKAMGEMIMAYFKQNLPVVIIRPTMVVSTFKEPFSGWIEGLRTIDTFILGYGKGRISQFIATRNTIYDLIPADMVVNAMIVAMVAHAKKPMSMANAIYQIGSSLKNPMKCRTLETAVISYFTKRPLIDKNGKTIKVGKPKLITSMSSFHKQIAIKFLLLKALRVANGVSCCFHFDDILTKLTRKAKFGVRVVELYAPFLLFPGIFGEGNTGRLRYSMKQNSLEIEMFDFDSTNVDWSDYLRNIHIPGLLKYACK